MNEFRHRGAMDLVILTGASGSGKTTIAHAFAKRYPGLAEIYFFDSIGVPTRGEMLAEFGSGAEWQRRKTRDWLAQISARPCAQPILFEGQMRFSFIHEAAIAAGISGYTVILIDCDDQTRRDRLTAERAQPELASDEMMSWARHLREEALLTGDPTLDTSDLTVSEAVNIVRGRFRTGV